MKGFFQKVGVVVISIIMTLLLSIFFLVVVIELFVGLPFNKQVPVKEKSVLEISLSGKVVECLKEDGYLLDYKKDVIDLVVLKNSIKQAKEDKRIAGIYLKCDNLQIGWANLKELHEALKNFKVSGKFIVAYGEKLTQKVYYLASLADDIVLNPGGMLLFQGLNMTRFFYKDLFDKLNIKPMIFRSGNYKSAIEPFMRNNMSEEDRAQRSHNLHSLYEHYINNLAANRNKLPQDLKQIANELPVLNPEDACKVSLISCIGHVVDVEALIKQRLMLNESDKINFVPFINYKKGNKAFFDSKNKIAIVVVAGDIIDGKSITDEYVGSDNFVKIMQDVRENQEVKAVVLRINSPGGSGLAAEIMWKAVELTNAVKPVVASMSDCAASAGYEIAMPCSYIFAHPTTITGSIGVFCFFMDPTTLLKNIGITSDGVRTAPSADCLLPRTELTEKEFIIIQKNVDYLYGMFLQKVSSGRKLDINRVKELASGKVYTGEGAYTYGLVDELGGLDEAVSKAAALASIEEYSIYFAKESKSKIAKLLAVIEKLLNYFYCRYNNLAIPCLCGLTGQFPSGMFLKKLYHMQGIQARLPYELIIE